MASQITKKDLETILDRKLGEYQEVILDAINTKFSEVDQRLGNIEKTIQSLATTLDAFMKRMMDHEDEFTIMKAELNLIKKVLKEKFGIKISLQDQPRVK